jgi:glycosyltransferase involved in cell wall biosynthesis
MRILYLSQLIPYPADAGPKTRIYHVLQYLSLAGHQLTLVAFSRAENTPETINHLRRYCEDVYTVPMVRSRIRDAWELTKGVFSSRPFLISRDSIIDMHRLLEKLLRQQQFDAIHADQLWMAQYGLAAKMLIKDNSAPRLILDQHNAVHMVPQRLAGNTSNPVIRAFLQMESRKLVRYELKTCEEFDHVVWVTQEDRQALANKANGRSRFDRDLVIPICVDPEETPPVKRLSQARRITFLGGMHWPPNALGISWFAREVWPLVRVAVPESLLTVIGKHPPESLFDQKDGNIDVTGYAYHLAPYLADTAVFIVPLQAGGGMRVKILDAWNWALPVVSTSIGAEGLHYKDGHNLLIADQPHQFASAIISVLRDPELASRLSAAGRETVQSLYNWREVYKAWDELYPC